MLTSVNAGSNRTQKQNTNVPMDITKRDGSAVPLCLLFLSGKEKIRQKERIHEKFRIVNKL